MTVHTIDIDKLCLFLKKPKSEFNSIISYNNHYIEYSTDKIESCSKFNNNIKSNINDFFDKIRLVNGDSNYYIESICEYLCGNFDLYCSKHDLSNIIKIINNNNQIYNTYKNTIYDNIISTKFLINKKEYTLQNIVKLFFNDITVNNKLMLLNTLLSNNKLDIIYNKILQDDNVILKLLHEFQHNEIDINNIIKYNETLDIFVFNKFKNYYKNKYSTINSTNTTFNDTEINNDIEIINKLLNNNLDKNNITRIMLLTIKTLLDNVKSNYYDNNNYRKINIKNETSKYTNFDITNVNKNNTYFDVKNSNEIMYNYKELDKHIDIHTDMFTCYYNARYPDRNISYDYVQSSMFVKTSFLQQQYCIHMSVIQYVVLDIIINNKFKIFQYHDFDDLNIDNNVLKIIISGFIKIELLFNYKTGFILNNSFEHDNPTFSIYYLLMNQLNNNINTNDNKIVCDDKFTRFDNLINIVHNHIKNSCMVYKDSLYDELQNKIDNYSENDVFYVIELLLDDNKIYKQTIDENGYSRVIYKI